jgi:hypothetical protein
MSATEHVVGSEVAADNTIVVLAAPVVAARSTGAYAVIPGLITVPITPSTERNCILHAHVDVRGASQITGAPRLRVDLRIEVSINNGATWTYQPGTLQSFQMRETGNLCSTAASPKVPGLKPSVTWTVRVGGLLATTYLWRVAFQTTNDASVPNGVDPTFQTGTIFVETLGA